MTTARRLAAILAADVAGYSRLMGAVFVSNTVYDHVRDRLPFVFEDLGEQQVKNIVRPVRVYRVGTTLTHPDASAPGSPSPALRPVIRERGFQTEPSWTPSPALRERVPTPGRSPGEAGEGSARLGRVVRRRARRVGADGRPRRGGSERAGSAA